MGVTAPVMTEQEYSASLFRRDLHLTMIQARGITIKDVAAEIGISASVTSRYLACGGTEEMAERVEKAIDAISERRGLTPQRTVRPVSGPWPDGLPDVITAEGEYRKELVLRDLMRAPGRDV